MDVIGFNVTIKTFQTSLIAVSLSLCLGCSRSQIQPSSSAKGLTTTRLWQKLELVLCWNSPINALTQFVTADLQKEYTPDKTKIYFSGFKSCAETPNADVAIEFDENLQDGLGGIASQIGQFVVPDEMSDQIFGNLKYPTVKLSQRNIASRPFKGGVTREQGISEVALHEMGHMVGLFHEHAHPQSTCQLQESALNKGSMGPDAADAYIDHGSPYDPYSIMSYCKIDSSNFGKVTDSSVSLSLVHHGLSDGDRAFLSQVYGGNSSNGTNPTPSPSPGPNGGKNSNPSPSPQPFDPNPNLPSNDMCECAPDASGQMCLLVFNNQVRAYANSFGQMCDPGFCEQAFAEIGPQICPGGVR